ncbi:hypothetical protein [Thalassoglobus polymorphus]|uniref:Uncharacterized protein n=1 Tax=Thalassoglobus polymorphus TaxID=2527994 RepID=A0A517QPT1_9PLAN|nr:hypothetical protein [Thalassoglobus polymorphus]QDT33635.1 hypothetical protein Mal48_28890 [Thalassoglobus polymorphus]
MHDESLDRILESLCQIQISLESLRVSVTSMNDVLGDHETRLRKIEVWKHNLTPVLAVLTFVLGAIFSVAVGKVIS